MKPGTANSDDTSPESPIIAEFKAQLRAKTSMKSIALSRIITELPKDPGERQYFAIKTGAAVADATSSGKVNGDADKMMDSCGFIATMGQIVCTAATALYDSQAKDKAAAILKKIKEELEALQKQSSNSASTSTTDDEKKKAANKAEMFANSVTFIDQIIAGEAGPIETFNKFFIETENFRDHHDKSPVNGLVALGRQLAGNQTEQMQATIDGQDATIMEKLGILTPIPDSTDLTERLAQYSAFRENCGLQQEGQKTNAHLEVTFGAEFIEQMSFAEKQLEEEKKKRQQKQISSSKLIFDPEFKKIRDALKSTTKKTYQPPKLSQIDEVAESLESSKNSTKSNPDQGQAAQTTSSITIASPSSIPAESIAKTEEKFRQNLRLMQPQSDITIKQTQPEEKYFTVSTAATVTGPQQKEIGNSCGFIATMGQVMCLAATNIYNQERRDGAIKILNNVNEQLDKIITSSTPLLSDADKKIFENSKAYVDKILKREISPLEVFSEFFANKDIENMTYKADSPVNGLVIMSRKLAGLEQGMMDFDPIEKDNHRDNILKGLQILDQNLTATSAFDEYAAVTKNFDLNQTNLDRTGKNNPNLDHLEAKFSDSMLRRMNRIEDSLAVGANQVLADTLSIEPDKLTQTLQTLKSATNSSESRAAITEKLVKNGVDQVRAERLLRRALADIERQQQRQNSTSQGR